MLEWRSASDRTEPAQRFTGMLEDAVKEHGAGPVITALAITSGAVIEVLSTRTGLTVEEILATAAREALGDGGDAS